MLFTELGFIDTCITAVAGLLVKLMMVLQSIVLVDP